MVRVLLVGVLLGISAAASAQPPGPSQPFAAELQAVFARTGVDPAAISVEAPEAAAFPVIDAHNHLNGDMSAEELLARMNSANVEAMVLMPRHYRSPGDRGLASDEQARDYTQRHPGKFIPFVGGQRDDLAPRSYVWQHSGRADVLLGEFGEKLKSEGYAGIGEFILVHHAYDVGGGETGGEIRLDVDHELMHRIAKLARAHRVPVLFHAEAEDRPAAQAEALFAASPDTLFIWAHNCGRASAARIAERLRRFPNLMCDLGHMFNGPRTKGGYGKSWPRKTSWIFQVQDDVGRVLPEMKRLFDEFPDRFMIGTDTAHTPYLRSYEYRIAIFRIMLAQLKPEAARKIGFENAQRLFKRP